MKENEIIFNESKKYMPGGVNSPVRSYRGMDMTPPVIKSGKGAIIVDEEGKEYIDFVLAWGPLLLGHCNEKVVEAIKETSEKAKLKAILRIIPIEAIEDFDLTLELTDSLEVTE